MKHGGICFASFRFFFEFSEIGILLMLFDFFFEIRFENRCFHLKIGSRDDSNM